MLDRGNDVQFWWAQNMQIKWQLTCNCFVVLKLFINMFLQFRKLQKIQSKQQNYTWSMQYHFTMREKWASHSYSIFFVILSMAKTKLLLNQRFRHSKAYFDWNCKLTKYFVIQKIIALTSWGMNKQNLI